MISIHRDVGGQIAVFTIGIAMVVFGVAGIAVDGTRAFLFRRTLQNAADAMALAAAAELDESAFYDSGGREITLDPAAASEVAKSYLAARGLDATAEIQATSDGVVVVLRGSVPTSFLGVVGLTDLPAAVESRAVPVAGSALGGDVPDMPSPMPATSRPWL